MKTHNNTLFVTTEGAYLSKDGQAVAVKIERQTKLRIPLHNLDGIVCFGRVGCSPILMAACAEAGVSISFVSPEGRFRAAIVGFSPGNVLLRRQQYRAADDPASSLRIAQAIVAVKVSNARSVLLRGARDARTAERAEALNNAARKLAATLVEIRRVDTLDRLRGLEGESAANYFSAFNELISVEGSLFRFEKRSRRPPLDPVNALLSFVYAMLAHDARSACETVGLDAAVGFLHRDRPGRPGMALDIMEEFRPFFADRLVLSLINRRQVEKSGFRTLETGAVVMNDATRKAVLVAYQKRKQVVVQHPFLQEKTSIGLLVHLQARLMARHLRGDLDGYPPFVWR